jgi:NAD(P)H-dependent flavin oxidoreductase YrpB (nitropropane dioxygenase family)
MFGILHPIIQSGMHYVGFAELASAISDGLRIITGLTQKRRTHRARGAGASGFSQLAVRAPRAATLPRR